MTTHIPHVQTDTIKGARVCVQEKIKEVKETMEIKYWHDSNRSCRDWWDSIEKEDFKEIAYIELGCVCIETQIDYRGEDIEDKETPNVSYVLFTKTKNGEWDEQGYISSERLANISRHISWVDIFNDMLYELISYCLEYEIDYEAKYWSMKSDIVDEVDDKLSAELSDYVKSISDRTEAIQSHYSITMMNEFKIAISELCKTMKPKDIRVKFIESENTLRNFFNEFIRTDTGETEVYKEFILNTIKED